MIYACQYEPQRLSSFSVIPNILSLVTGKENQSTGQENPKFLPNTKLDIHTMAFYISVVFYLHNKGFGECKYFLVSTFTPNFTHTKKKKKKSKSTNAGLAGK